MEKRDWADHRVEIAIKLSDCEHQKDGEIRISQILFGEILEENGPNDFGANYAMVESMVWEITFPWHDVKLEDSSIVLD